MFGFYLVFLGEHAFLNCVRLSPILNRIWAHPVAEVKTDCLSVIARQDRLPFIADEIDSLTTRSGITYRQVAILVRDRYQAMRLTEYLESRQILLLVTNQESLVTDRIWKVRLYYYR